ncbi:mobile element protein [Vibrio variabilis]|uniref:Mobile element protein n=1 Tax=Vibrio variabilis TaxID=990271 RepID=A0ABQ0JQT3_9VIBR|nr:mobile element protein [Vibrio variabilis]
MSDFKGRHFTRDIILWAVQWYSKHGISYRELAEMLLKQEVSVSHITLISMGTALCTRDRTAATLGLEARLMRPISGLVLVGCTYTLPLPSKVVLLIFICLEPESKGSEMLPW